MNLVYRSDTYDKNVISEMGSAYGHLKFEGKRVLDLGGNIGAFAVFALEKGAATVFSYEPEPDNFNLLLQNTASFQNAFAFRSAVVKHKMPSVKLMLNSGINKGSHSLFIKRGRVGIDVPCETIASVILQHAPEVVKIDIEGGEYDLLEHLDFFLPTVKQLCVEFHLGKKIWRKKFREIHEKLAASFDIQKSPKDTGKNWHTIGSYERK